MFEFRIGKDVHYVSLGSAGGEYPSTCRAAKLTAIHRDGDELEADLFVMNPTGTFFNRSPYHAGEVPGGYRGGTWHTTDFCPN